MVWLEGGGLSLIMSLASHNATNWEPTKCINTLFCVKYHRNGAVLDHSIEIKVNHYFIMISIGLTREY